MRWLLMSLVVVGLTVMALGVLWFLQGSDLIRIDPIACAGNCEPMVGHHPGWQAAGAIAATTGALATTVSVRKLRGPPAG